jgi:hypothetical protein
LNETNGRTRRLGTKPRAAPFLLFPVSALAQVFDQPFVPQMAFDGGNGPKTPKGQNQSDVDHLFSSAKRRLTNNQENGKGAATCKANIY